MSLSSSKLISFSFKARNVITNNLKKNKLISKSCVNLSFTQELAETRLGEASSDGKDHFKNTIPNTPSSASSLNDLLTSDPRRSSTPMNANAKSRKWRRSASNAWAKPQSPLGSPLSNQATQSAANLFSTGSTDAPLSFEPSSVTTKTESSGVVRRSDARRTRRTRPRSMVVQPVTVRDKDSDIAVVPQRSESFRTTAFSTHSDTEIDLNGMQEVSDEKNGVQRERKEVNFASRIEDIVSDKDSEQLNHFVGRGGKGEENESFFVTNSPLVSPIRSSLAPLDVGSTPVKSNNTGGVVVDAVRREMDIDEQKHRISSLGSVSESERVRFVAMEIEESVRNLQLQQQQQQQPQKLGMGDFIEEQDENYVNEEEGDEVKDTKELIRLYETGLIGTNGKKLVSRSPPERDTPNSPNTPNTTTVHQQQVRSNHSDNTNVVIVIVGK